MTLAPDGRKLLRLEVRNARRPDREEAGLDQDPAAHRPGVSEAAGAGQAEGLHTVCQEAGCPNIYECWEDREATFLIGGDQCTRRCDFCLIDTGKPGELDRDEPRRVAESIQTMDLRYATITGVTRDDLPDEGAWLYAETVRQVHEQAPGTGVEILTPDFSGKPELLGQVFDAPAGGVRAQPGDGAADLPADPAGVHLRQVAGRAVAGPGGRHGHQVQPDPRHGRDPRPRSPQALRDMHAAGCDLVTITQYLRPSPRHHPVERWVKPEEFVELHAEGRGDRFRRRHVRSAGPLVLQGGHAVPAGRRGARDPAQGAAPSAPGWRRDRADAQVACCGPRRSVPGHYPDDEHGQECRRAGASSQAADKDAKKAAKAAKRVAAKERRSQIWQAFQMQRKQDKRLLPLMIGALVGIAAAVVTLGLMWFLPWWMVLPFGILLGAMVAMIIFSRRVQANVYSRPRAPPAPRPGRCRTTCAASGGSPRPSPGPRTWTPCTG